MKKVLFAILPVIAFVSCLKSDNRDPGVDYSGEGYLKYDLNGYPYEYTGGPKSLASRSIGVYVKKQLKSGSVPSTRYTIIGQIGATKQLNIVIITDSLKTGSYTTSTYATGVTSVKVDSVTYANNRTSDFLTVNISNYAAGIIEGTVSGKLSMSKTSGGTTTYTDAMLANGAFKNVVVQYP